MTLSILFLFLAVVYVYEAYSGTLPLLQGDYSFFSVTNVLIASGIIGICTRLDEIIKK